MVGSSLYPFGGGLADQGVLFYRWAAPLHAPSSFVECGYSVKGQTQVAAHQVQGGRSVSVFEDLPGQRQRTVEALEPYCHRDLPQIRQVAISMVVLKFK